AAEVVGSITERDLLEALVTGRAAPGDPVSAHMSAPLPMIGSGEPIGAAIAALEKAGAAVVLVDGKPTGMITRQDVLMYLAGERSVQTTRDGTARHGSDRARGRFRDAGNPR